MDTEETTTPEVMEGATEEKKEEGMEGAETASEETSSEEPAAM